MATSRKSAVIEGRVDATTLATLTRYFTLKGLTPVSKSDLVWKTFEMLCSALVASGSTQPFDSTETAYAYLEEMGLSSVLKEKGRYRKSAIEALQDDALIADFDSNDYLTNQQKTKSSTGVTAEQVREALDRMERRKQQLPTINEQSA